MIELERTFLIRSLPVNWRANPQVNIGDRYFPIRATHPNIRLRRQGKEFSLTKKHPLVDNVSWQEEQTILLTASDFQVFKKIPARIINKTRYYYRWHGKTIEFDVFRGALAGLVLADVEFSTRKQLRNFRPPNFLLAEITQEKVIVGGKLAGKKLRDLKIFLQKYNYRPIRT